MFKLLNSCAFFHFRKWSCYFLWDAYLKSGWAVCCLQKVFVILTPRYICVSSHAKFLLEYANWPSELLSFTRLAATYHHNTQHLQKWFSILFSQLFFVFSNIDWHFFQCTLLLLRPCKFEHHYTSLRDGFKKKVMEYNIFRMSSKPDYVEFVLL